jgi:hypothetical protein
MATRHEHLDGTVHVDDPTRQLDAAREAAGRRPLHVAPALVDARLLVVAALVASPAAYRSAQGLLSVSEAMTRYLLIALGCVIVSVVVRLLWPVLAGEDPVAVPRGGSDGAGPGFAVLDEGVEPLDALDSPGAVGTLGTFDEGDVDGFAGFSAFDDLDALELSSG